MDLKYYVFSFCNGELLDEKEFETKEKIKEYLKENFLSEIIIIHGLEVTEDYV